MAGTSTDPWIIDFLPNGPRFTPPGKGFTIYMLPKHLLERSPDYDYFKIGNLQLGLQNRTLTPDKVAQNLQLEIASALHRRLSHPPAPPAPPATPADPIGPVAPLSTTRSWDEFTEAVVANADFARSHFEKPTDDPRMSDAAVQNHLALDALFIVFYFQDLNNRTFNIKEFDTLAQVRGATLKSLRLSDFLLLENQVPMYLLKKVVQELCKIDDELPAKLAEFSGHAIPFESLVEHELNKVLILAVLNLLPISEPTVVRPIPDFFASRNIFAIAVKWISTRMSMDGASSAGACMRPIRGCWRETKPAPQQMLVEYIYLYYPPHLPHALENCKHILDCVYRVVCGHVQPPYEWDLEQLENPFLESIPGATRLEEVGIKAEHSTQCTGNSVELTHGRRTWIRSAGLKLPKVDILDSTARHFRNLAIYEQLMAQDLNHYNSDLRCFLVCMNELCRDAVDLRLLSKRGVINVHVRNEVAVSMWGRILEGVERPIPSHAWKEFYNNVHKHRHSRWKRWRRKSCGMHLSQPWKKLSIVAAVVLLSLTALQTWFTVVNSPYSKERWPSRN